MVFTRIVVKTEESQARRAWGNGKHINLLTREFRQTRSLWLPGCRLLEISGEEKSQDALPSRGCVLLHSLRGSPVLFCIIFSAPVAPGDGLQSERYHQQPLIKTSTGSNYHYTLIGASSQHPAKLQGRATLGGPAMISFLTESLLPVTH